MQKVPIGPATVAGGTITLASYATAVVAFAKGARDEATVSMLTIGTVTLVTTLAGRYGQAIAHVLQAGAPLTPLEPVKSMEKGWVTAGESSKVVRRDPDEDADLDWDKAVASADPGALREDLDDPGLPGEVLLTPTHTGLKD